MKNSETKKAVILVRVSSKEQEEGHSIDGQKDRLIKYCLNHDLEILKIYELVESSTRRDRKEFMEMISFVER